MICRRRCLSFFAFLKKIRHSAIIVERFFRTFYEKSEIPIDKRHIMCYTTKAQKESTSYRGVEQLVARRAHNPEVRRFKSPPRNQQKTHFCLPTKVLFLNDVCLRQMMLATPMMTASPNDVCLTAHWANIASLRNVVEQHHICEANASYRRRRCII